jgi:hypothetical protein
MRRVELSRVSQATALADKPLLVAGNASASDIDEVLPHLARECVQGLELTGQAIGGCGWMSNDSSLKNSTWQEACTSGTEVLSA